MHKIIRQHRNNNIILLILLYLLSDLRVHLFTGVQRDQVDVVELHDCFSCNELITYEALGLCEPGNSCFNTTTSL